MFLAVDYGGRYVGLAATDYEGKIPYRYGVLDQKQVNVLAELQAIIAKEKTKTVLVGVPVSLSGSVTEQTRVSLDFIQKLRAILPNEVVIEEVDETLTSVEAQRLISAEGGNKDLEHAEAARILLEDYLREKSH